MQYLKTLVWFGALFLLLRIPAYGLNAEKYLHDVPIILLGPMFFVFIVNFVAIIVNKFNGSH